MNNLKQENILIANAFQGIGPELTVSLAKLKCNIVLTGAEDAEKITKIVTDISNLGVQSFHHGSSILDSKQVVILLDDIERLMGSLTKVVILITPENYKFLSFLIDNLIFKLNKQDCGKIVIIFVTNQSTVLLDYKIELDNLVKDKLKNFKNLKFLSIEENKISNVSNVTTLILE